MQRSPKMTAPEDKTLSTWLRPHVRRLKAVSLLINGAGKRGERTQGKKMCPDLRREIIMTETPSSVLHAITVNQPLKVATAFFLYLKSDQTLLMRSYHQRSQ